MTFYYQGTERLSLIFGTPNRCAIVLGIVLLLLTGLFVDACTKSDRASAGRLVTRFALGAAIVALIAGIALTYSRGGYLAVTAGLLVTAILVRDRRWLVVAVLGLGVLAVAVIPHGGARVASITAFESDFSIRNRLILWRGTLAMLWDWCPSTVGLFNLRHYYPAWYQPAEMAQRYLTPVNDYLTIALSIGFAGLAAYLAVLFGTLSCAARTAWHSRSAPLAGAIGATGVYLIAGLTSTYIVQPPVAATFVVALGGVILGLIRYRTTWNRAAWRRWFTPGVGIGVTAALALVVAARVAAAHAPYRPAAPAGGEQGVTWAETEPRHREVEGNALLIVEHWDLVRQVRNFVRPLVDAGYRVTMFTPGDFGAAGIQHLEDFFSTPGRQRSHVIAFGDSGRLLLLPSVRGAAQPRTITLVGLAASSPLPAFSPLRNIVEVSSPVLLAHAREDPKVDSASATKLYDRCRAGERSAQLAILESSDHSVADNPRALMQAILAFITKETKP